MPKPLPPRNQCTGWFAPATTLPVGRTIETLESKDHVLPSSGNWFTTDHSSKSIRVIRTCHITSFLKTRYHPYIQDFIHELISHPIHINWRLCSNTCISKMHNEGGWLIMARLVIDGSFCAALCLRISPSYKGYTLWTQNKPWSKSVFGIWCWINLNNKHNIWQRGCEKFNRNKCDNKFLYVCVCGLHIYKSRSYVWVQNSLIFI